MKVTLIKTKATKAQCEGGDTPVSYRGQFLSFEIDGKTMSSAVEAQRVITGTTHEDAMGIFTFNECLRKFITAQGVVEVLLVPCHAGMIFYDLESAILVNRSRVMNAIQYIPVKHTFNID